MARRLAQAAGVLCALLAAGCRAPVPEKPAAGSGDAAFAALAAEVLTSFYEHHPSTATDLGLHQYDDRLEDLSAAGRATELAAVRALARSQQGAKDLVALAKEGRLSGVLPQVAARWPKRRAS
mgnify:CR=1 FL=1